MANEKEYPIAVFHFSVEWGGSRVGFTEVSGLTKEVQAIEYREGHSPDYLVTKMPGMQKVANITLKRGMFNGDGELMAWLKTVKLNKIERRDLTISLLDETHQPVMTWQIKDAWPCKVEGPSLKSTGNEFAVESVELCHEGINLIVA
ncbi:MAG: phage tail protein [Bacteroidia bacterium]|jgi:phage tail-like protein|nr:phage tail protein [Bacteroidia bacterium]